MKNLFLLLAFLLINLTLSYSQISSDSIKCYNRTVLVKIASKLIKGQECDSLLLISDIQLDTQSEIIRNDSLQIKLYKSVCITKEGIITGKNTEIQTLTTSLQRSQKELIWVKIGWGATTILLLTLLILK